MKIAKSWYELLKPEFEKPYYKELQKFLEEEYSHYTVYPEADNVFHALDLVPFDKVKVVIIGQDPYHAPRQAHGLCFSVQKGVPIPPSLQNIYKEIQNDLGYPIPKTGDLTYWARQGVLLLNSVLTVRAGQAGSHRGRGWEKVTDSVISLLDEREEPVVFMLWGAPARAKKTLITSPRHLILECPHPSPLSAYAGFFGCGHFRKANEFLTEHGLEPIDWRT